MKILVVEDEPLIAALVCEFLDELGHEPIGPISTVAEALDACDDCDLALIDLNLGGENSAPFVSHCRCQKIPHILTTGYSTLDPDFSEFTDSIFLMKPYDLGQIEEALKKFS